MGSCEITPLMEFDYDRVNNTILDTSKTWIIYNLGRKRKKLEILIKKKIKRKVQKSTVFFRDLRIDIIKDQPLSSILKICLLIEQRYNLKPAQILLHSSYLNKESYKNHYHVIFSCIDEKNGKTIKLNKYDFIEINQICKNIKHSGNLLYMHNLSLYCTDFYIKSLFYSLKHRLKINTKQNSMLYHNHSLTNSIFKTGQFFNIKPERNLHSLKEKRVLTQKNKAKESDFRKHRRSLRGKESENSTV